MKPILKTRITNPTSQRKLFTWVNPNGLWVDPGCSRDVDGAYPTACKRDSDCSQFEAALVNGSVQIALVTNLPVIPVTEQLTFPAKPLTPAARAARTPPPPPAPPRPKPRVLIADVFDEAALKQAARDRAAQAKHTSQTNPQKIDPVLAAQAGDAIVNTLAAGEQLLRVRGPLAAVQVPSALDRLATQSEEGVVMLGVSPRDAQDARDARAQKGIVELFKGKEEHAAPLVAGPKVPKGPLAPVVAPTGNEFLSSDMPAFSVSESDAVQALAAASDTTTAEGIEPRPASPRTRRGKARNAVTTN